MTLLLSPVGDTDPIRGFHDGALLHIARKYRPEKIVIVHSQRSLVKHANLERAIFSISEKYRPQIISHEVILLNADVAYYDRMFEQFQEIVPFYFSKDDDMILNLSSGTPQMKAALFVTNLLSKFEIKAIQVFTPQEDSNEGTGHDNNESIDELIDTNEDNRPDFVDRTVEDEAENFRQALLKKTARDLIQQYDYKATLDILNNLSDFDGLSSARRMVQDLVVSLNKQDIPRALHKKKYDEDSLRILNAYLTIELQKKRGNVSECFIRIQNLSEFILADYIERNYPNAINNFCQSRGKAYYPNLRDFITILKSRGEQTFRGKTKHIGALRNSRNQLAHTLNPITSENVRLLSPAIRELKMIIMEQYKFTQEDFDFYTNVNERLLGRLY